MHKALFFLFFLISFNNTFGQTIIASEDFESGAGNWTMNTTELSSTNTGYNEWAINNVFAGGIVNFPISIASCNDLGCFGFTSLPVPNQPISITNNPQSNYMHIRYSPSYFGCAPGNANAHYLVANTLDLCALGSENYFTRMNTGFNTTGQTNVTIAWWWTGITSSFAFGEMYYSIDGGGTWILGQSAMFNQPNWTKDSLTLVAFDNQADLRIGFRFVNSDGGGAGADHAFGFDQIEVQVPSGGNPPTASFSASDTIICEGECINFTDLSTNAPTSWSWNFPGSISGSSIDQNPTNICYNTTGIYDVDLIATNGSGSDNSIAIGLINVYPQVSFDAESDTSICEGDSVELNINNLVGGLLVDSFTMSFTSQFTYTTTPTVAGGIYYIVVSGTYFGAAGELRDAAYKFENNSAPITPIPSSVWKLDGVGPGRPCPTDYNPNHLYYFYFTGTGAGVTFTFDDTNYSDNGGNLIFKVYYLSANSNGILWSNGEIEPCITVAPTQTTTYTATIRNNTGICVDNDSVTVNIITPITINAGPDTNICGGPTPGSNSYSITGSAIGPGGAVMTWIALGDGNFDIDTILNPIYTPGVNDDLNGSVDLVLMGVDTMGLCAPVFDTMTLLVNPIAKTNAGIDDTICAGESYISAGTFGGSATSSTWSTLGDGAFNDSTLLNATYVPGGSDISTGFVYLILTTDDPVGNCGPALDSVLIIINPLPIIDSVSIVDASTCLINDGVAVIYANNGTPPYQFSITGGAPFSSAAYFPNLSIGSYDAVVTDTLGCTSNIQSFTISTAGLPPAPSVNANATYCDGESISDLSASPNSGGTITWYDILGDSLGTGLTFSPFDSIGTLVYYATEDVGGCESPGDSVTITINPTTFGSQTPSICSNDSIFLEGAYQTTSGTYSDTLTGINGCDSVVISILSVNQTTASSQALNICAGDSIFLGGAYQNTTGTYFDTLAAGNGCDSVLTSNLIVSNIATGTQAVSICNNDSVLLGGTYQNTSGTYFDTLIAINGCDSILTSILTVNDISSGSQAISICSNDSVFLGGAYQNTEGTYNDTLIATSGCDSVMATTLTINATPVITLSNDTSIELGESALLQVSGADSYIWSPSTGLSLSAGASVSAGPDATTTYTVTATDINGCIAYGDVTVIVSSNNVVFLPNTFSPVSSISDNSRLHVFGHGIETMELVVYDRWGAVVYKTDDVEKYNGHCCAYGLGWEGQYLDGDQSVNTAVFVYKLNGVFINGEEFSLKGNVTLIK